MFIGHSWVFLKGPLDLLGIPTPGGVELGRLVRGRWGRAGGCRAGQGRAGCSWDIPVMFLDVPGSFLECSWDAPGTFRERSGSLEGWAAPLRAGRVQVDRWGRAGHGRAGRVGARPGRAGRVVLEAFL